MIELKLDVSRILGMQFSANPERYLGLPNMVGRNKRASFQHLKDKIKSRIDGWSIRVLSQDDKEIFVKSILQAIPTYAMNCFCSLSRSVRILRVYLPAFGGKKGVKREGYIGASGDICASLRIGYGFSRYGEF